MKITYLGHSAFEITTANHKILIDPFLVCIPHYDYSSVTEIFVTHAHGDHLGSAIEISKKTGARVTAIFELANHINAQGGAALGVGLGGLINYEWGRAVAVPAFHSSSTADGVYGGCPCGFVFQIEGKTIYHAGDTCLNQEMKTIGELYNPDIAMLPVGGHFTMDIEQAVIASDWLGASDVIPMHYNTFEAIEVNIKDFERQIRELGKMPIVMKAGQTL